MAREIHTITLSSADWGKVAVAVNSELRDALGLWKRLGNSNLKRGIPLCVKIDALSRIRKEIREQRRAIRYGQKTGQSVSGGK